MDVSIGFIISEKGDSNLHIFRLLPYKVVFVEEYILSQCFSNVNVGMLLQTNPDSLGMA